MNTFLFACLVFSPVLFLMLHVEFSRYGARYAEVVSSLSVMAGWVGVVLDIVSLIVGLFTGPAAVAALWLLFFGGNLSWVMIILFLGAFLEPWICAGTSWGNTFLRSIVIAFVFALLYGIYLLVATVFPFL